MTVKEKDKLGILASRIYEITRILHSPSSDSLLSELEKCDDNDVFDLLISHLDSIRIYQLYAQFDREASVRDIENLLNIINEINKEAG